MNQIKKNIVLIACLFLILPCFAKSAPKDKKAVFGISQSEYDDLLNTSLVSTGNNYRLKKIIEKIKSGDTVYVTALGGSVTEGVGPANYTDGYAYQFIKKLGKEYSPNKGSKIIFNGAGLSGTPSLLGLVRYESDVVQPYNHTPDLLIVEFAVNDGSGRDYERAFEAIIRNALIENDETAIIILYSAATYNNQESWMRKIADYYELPQVSVMNLVNVALKDGKFKEKDYYVDTVHPTKNGHEVQADCLMNLINKIYTSDVDEKNQLPESEYCAAPTFVGMKKIFGDNEDVKITKGCFNSVDISGQIVSKTQKTNFQQNWYHQPGKKGDSFVMDINCKNLVLVYQKHGNWDNLKFGYAEVYVDDVLVDTLDGTGGWNNAVAQVIIDENECKNHRIEIKMAPGSEKKGFVILSLGYSK